jgi:hypothetical protein
MIPEIAKFNGAMYAGNIFAQDAGLIYQRGRSRWQRKRNNKYFHNEKFK